MYQALLTRRYLTRKIMPLLASLAVVLCTAMVLITWSVMGGFLRMLTESGRSLIGDVRIVWPQTGFAHYDDLIDRLEADPMIGAATPVIDTFASITLPDGRTDGVQVRGIDGPSFAKVTTYSDALYWKPLEQAVPRDKQREDPRLRARTRDNSPPTWEQLKDNGLALTRPDFATGEPVPAVVPGIEVTRLNLRETWGGYSPLKYRTLGADGSETLTDEFMPISGELTVRVFPLDSRGRPRESVPRVFPIANEFESGLYDVDSSTVLVHLETLQRMLRMDEAVRVVESVPLLGAEADPFADPFGGAQGFETEPARVTTVLVRHAQDDGDVDALRARCEEIYAEFAIAHVGEVPSSRQISIETWADANRTLIAAVEKETGLVLIVFTFISMTAVFLVLAIFWAMVSEKTRDIGILRALGAGQSGVAWVWVRYGGAIGIVGSTLGGALAWAIVSNINEIHDWMGQELGLYVWDPTVYVFKEIPREINPQHAAIVLIGGVASCLIGALIPAARAASMDPVRALRFE
ncbi:MAG: FtsX-like permease family protein [Planctomycetota bacterium]